MNHRKYHFVLPYEISGFEIAIGLGRLKSEGILDHLPTLLQKKIEYAAQQWQSLSITQTDLDSIDDHTWAKLASELNLSWS